MLIIGTLVVTWIAHNWWKLFLLLIAVISIHEYKLYKIRTGKKPEADNVSTEADVTGIETDETETDDTDTENDTADTGTPENDIEE